MKITPLIMAPNLKTPTSRRMSGHSFLGGGGSNFLAINPRYLVDSDSSSVGAWSICGGGLGVDLTQLACGRVPFLKHRISLEVLPRRLSFSRVELSPDLSFTSQHP